MEIMLHAKFFMQHCCIVYVDLLHATKLHRVWWALHCQLHLYEFNKAKMTLGY